MFNIFKIWKFIFRFLQLWLTQAYVGGNKFPPPQYLFFLTKVFSATELKRANKQIWLISGKAGVCIFRAVSNKSSPSFLLDALTWLLINMVNFTPSTPIIISQVTPIEAKATALHTHDQRPTAVVWQVAFLRSRERRHCSPLDQKSCSQASFGSWFTASAIKHGKMCVLP